MLYIKLVGMQRETNFAPTTGIPSVKSNYLPTGGNSYLTHIQGKVRISGTFDGDIVHQFKGNYSIDKLTNQVCKSFKRDLIALKGLHAGRVRVMIGLGERELYNDTMPLINLESTNKKLKTTILKLIHFNKTFNYEHSTN